MIDKILLYFIVLITIFSFIYYIFIILLGKKKNISSDNGFDITKDMIKEYEKINIIEGNNKFSYYNLKRKVIRLSKTDYYGTNISSISLSIMEGAISIIDQSKDKYLDIFRYLFSNLNILKLSGILIIIINMITYTETDSKIGILLILILEIILYLYNDILDRSLIIIKDKLNKIKKINNNDKIKIINFNYKVILINKIIFILGLVSIIRFVTIMLKIN